MIGKSNRNFAQNVARYADNVLIAFIYIDESQLEQTVPTSACRYISAKLAPLDHTYKIA